MGKTLSDFDLQGFSEKNRSAFRLIAICLVCVFGLLVYSNSFYTSFHFDDGRYIAYNQSIRNPLDIKAIWEFYPTRFMTFFSLALNYHFNKLDVFSYHVVNLIIHLTTAILIWWFIILIFYTPPVKGSEIAKYAELIAFSGSLIFTVHPIQTQAVVYISQRAASLMTLFYIASVALFIKARLAAEEGGHSETWKIYYVASLVTTVMAMSTKETAVTLPLAILLCEFCFFKSGKALRWGYIIPYLVALFVTPMHMISIRILDYELVLERREASFPITPWQYLLTEFRVIVTYLRLLLVPINQNLDYNYPIAYSLLKTPILASFLLLLSILAFGVRLFSRHRLISFAIFWFFLTLAPESSILPIRDVINEHRLYLPMIGYSIFVSASLFYLFRKRRIVFTLAILITIIMAYSILTYVRNTVWQNDISLWSDVIQKSPKKARGYNNRGIAYSRINKQDRAIADYTKGLGLKSNIKVKLYFNRGLSYSKKRLYDDAISDFTRVIRIDPFRAKFYDHRAFAYGQKGLYDQAIADYTKALRLNPPLPARTYNNRGVVYGKKQLYDQAIADYTKAIELKPNNSKAYVNRGIAYGQKHLYDQAIADYTKAIELGPNNVKAYHNRGEAYLAKGIQDRALSDFNKAIEIAPNPNSYFRKAVILEDMGRIQDAVEAYKNFMVYAPDQDATRAGYVKERIEKLKGK